MSRRGNANSSRGRILQSLALGLCAFAMGTVGTEGVSHAQVIIQGPPLPVPRVWGRPYWMRPRVVFTPPAVRMVVPGPPCCIQPVPPPVYVAPPPPPPPPVYVQPQVQPQAPCCAQLPPPPVYVQPQQPAPPVIVPAPTLPAPVYVQQPAPQVVATQPQRPDWRNRVGIGARFAGVVNVDRSASGDAWLRSSHLGFGGELLFRVARHLSLEVAAEGQRTVDQNFTRWDVPVTFGMRIHIGPPNWVVSPYFALASGLTYSNLDFLRAHDVAWFAEGQLGGGLEVRLGHRFALTGDIRGVGRMRLSDPDEAAAATTAINGKPFQPMANQGGAQFRLGAALYF